MLNLTRASVIARKTIRYTIYFVILFFVAQTAIRFGVSIYERVKPAPKPIASVGFGVLPKLPFPESKRPDNLTITLETADDTLPVFPKILEVYFMPKASTNINVVDQAKQRAKRLGFLSEGNKIVETVYAFKHPSAPSTLTMNIITNVFSISYDIKSNLSVLSRIPPGSDTAISTINRYLSGAGYPTSDLTGPSTYEYLRVQGGEFVSAISLSEADLTKINLYRKKLGENEIPSVSPDPNESNVWFILSGISRNAGDSIIAGEYHYYPIDEEKIETYLLKTAQDAWDELTGGEGYIASMGDNPDGNVIVRSVYLAYYDSGQYVEFYQPVIVFEGDNGFAAYVSAITSQYYGGED